MNIRSLGVQYGSGSRGFFQGRLATLLHTFPYATSSSYDEVCNVRVRLSCLCFSPPHAFANSFADTNFDSSGRKNLRRHTSRLQRRATPIKRDPFHALPPLKFYTRNPSALMTTSCLTQEPGFALSLTHTFLFRFRQTGAAPLADLCIVSAYPAGSRVQ